MANPQYQPGRRLPIIKRVTAPKSPAASDHIQTEIAIATKRNTFAKRQREQEKKQRADQKRTKREQRKTQDDAGVQPPSSTPDYGLLDPTNPQTD